MGEEGSEEENKGKGGEGGGGAAAADLFGDSSSSESGSDDEDVSAPGKQRKLVKGGGGGGGGGEGGGGGGSEQKEPEGKDKGTDQQSLFAIPGLSSSEDSDSGLSSSGGESEDSSDEEAPPAAAAKGKKKRTLTKTSKKKGAAATAASKKGKAGKRERASGSSATIKKKKRGEKYAGGEERTKEDNDFIDDSDDDKELLAEYAGEPRPPGSDSEAEEDNTPEDNRSSSVMDDVLKALHRRKGQDLTSGQREAIVQQFLHAMDRAAAADEIAIESGAPALRKLKLLKAVKVTLSKQDLTETLLEYDMLSVIRRWIQPYSNRVLPTLSVRIAMLDVLRGLPVQIDQLKRSGVGKVLIMLVKHPDETEENKRKIKEIVDKWNRPIFQKSTNPKALTEMREHTDMLSASPTRKVDDSQRVQRVGLNFLPDTSAKTQDSSSSRVRVPISMGLSFKRAPASKVNLEQASARASALSSGTKAALMKKMKTGGRGK